jgi:photosystem II stability/assembly factor-like uncharacterized protein
MRKPVVIVAYEGVQLLDVAGPADVLDVATKVLTVPADKRHSGSLDVALAADFSSGSEGYTCLVATPDGRSVRTSSTVPAAPSSFDANASDPGPSVAIAHYDPQTGQYATPDGTVAQQTDLVDPPKSWQDLIFKAAP